MTRALGFFSIPSRALVHFLVFHVFLFFRCALFFFHLRLTRNFFFAVLEVDFFPFVLNPFFCVSFLRVVSLASLWAKREFVFERDLERKKERKRERESVA